MPSPKKEPTNEEEAQDLRRYLEKGAAVSIEPKRRIDPAGGARLPLPLNALAVVPFAESAQDLAGSVEEDGEQVILEFTIENPVTSPDPILVYLTEEAARKNAGVEDPAFVGSVSFFVDPKADPEHAGHAQVFRFNVTDALKRTAGRAPAVAAFASDSRSVRPSIPDVERLARTPTVTAARFEVVRSTVGES